MLNNTTSINTNSYKKPVVLFSLYPKNSADNTKNSALQDFKSQAGTMHQPFDIHKKNARKYRTIFLGISLFFIALSLFIYNQSTSWLCGLYFENCAFAKASLSGICAFLAFASLFVGNYIKAEREAAAFIYSKAKRKLHALYVHHLEHLGFHRILVYFKKSATAVQMQRAYHDTLDKIHDIKEASLQLMFRISNAKDLDRQKRDKLMNQAMSELQEHLEDVLNAYDRHHEENPRIQKA